MKPFAVLLGVLLFAVVLCCGAQPSASFVGSVERPTVNLPVALRQINWLGPHGSGSCAWASLVMDLNWSGEYQLAQHIRASHGDGVTVQSLCKGMTAERIPYVWTAGAANVGLLEQALAGRRPVLVGVNFEHPNDEANHMILLIHIDDQEVCLLDNNRPRNDRWMSRDEFVNKYWIPSGSIALVPLFSPVPPLAH
jgi:hypothetical protein